MSIVVIRQQLETAFSAADGGIPTNFENVFYVPVKGVPFQRVQLLLGTPENPTMGDNFYRERGFLQVVLYYPLGAGPGDSVTRAQAIRDAFPRGRSFVTGKVTTTIDGTTARLPSIVEDDRFVVPLRIPFYSNVLP